MNYLQVVHVLVRTPGVGQYYFGVNILEVL
jgi:hypothetical protein